ncbi:MAG TPA: outer membrane protein assembly factor BamB [Steroidobacteraceae bacterium]
MRRNLRLARVASSIFVTALLIAGCSKDKKDAEPPAELVDLKPSLPVKRLWSDGVGGGGEKLRLSLGVDYENSRVYVAGRGGKVEALNPESGRSEWSTDTKLELSAGPGAGPGVVAVGTNDGDVVALDATNGKKLWAVKVSSEVLSTPLVTRDRVIVRTVDGRLRALSAADGKEIWSSEEPVPKLSLRGTAPPVLSGETVLCGFDSGKVVAYSLANGDVLWQAVVSTPRGRSELERLSDVDSAVKVAGNDAYAVGYQGRIAMIAMDSGQVWWGRDLSSYRGLAIDDDQVYVATSDGSVVALRRRDGTVLWQQDGLKRRGLSAPAVDGNAIVVGDFEGYLHWLDRNSGKFVAREHPGSARISAPPIAADGRVFVIDDDGKVAAFRSGAGKAG